MNEEDFLSRWSRRKRDAGEPSKAPAPEADEATSPANEPSTTPDPDIAPDAGKNPGQKPEEEFDLSTLPPLDSITATTDVTSFLRKGVPLELTRAALRRAWVADPAIRDFVGLAENAWDFNDPNAMPGFGPLDQTPEQVRELVARIIGGVRPAADDIASTLDPPPTSEAAKDSTALPNQRAAGPASPPSDPAAVPASIEDGTSSSQPAPNPADRDAASQNKRENPMKLAKSHGGALPR